MTKPMWPIFLWALQFLPAAFLITFSLWRLIALADGQADQRTSILALTVGVAWSLITLGMLLHPRGRSWLVDRRKEWCLSAATLVVCLLAADAALTALGLVPTIQYHRERSVAYSLGNFTRSRLVVKDILTDGRPTITINQRGFRGSTIEPQKPPGRVRVAFLGGSQVFDYDGIDWPERTGELLRRRGFDIDIINAGVPGHTTADSLGKSLTDIWTLDPDIIFVCQAWNDIKYFYRLSREIPYRGEAPRRAEGWTVDWRIYPSGIDQLLSMSAIYRQIRWGIATLLYDEEGRRPRSQSAPMETLELGIRQYRLNVDLVATLAHRIGARPVFCRQAHLATRGGAGEAQTLGEEYGLRITKLSHEQLMNAYDSANRTVEELANLHSALVIDMDSALSGYHEYFKDGIHFSPEGSAKASEIVADALQPIVEAKSL